MLLEQNRIAYCKFCNCTLVLNDTFKQEYSNHFSQPSHMEYNGGDLGEILQFQRKYDKNYIKNQKKFEQYIQRDQNQRTQINGKFKTQMKQIEKEENHNKKNDCFENENFIPTNLQTNLQRHNQEQSHLNQQIKNEIRTIEQNENLNIEQNQQQKEIQSRMDQNSRPEDEDHSFKGLIKKYFVKFIQDLAKEGFMLEAICFILAKTGKVAKQICIIKFQKAAEELKILSKNGSLNEELVLLFVDCAKKLGDQSGLVNLEYLIKQPCSPQELDKLLKKAKQRIIKQTQNELYLKFLNYISIATLTKLIKNLRSNQINELNDQIYQNRLEIDQQENKSKKTLGMMISNQRMEIENFNEKNKIQQKY